ncbi:hypothetical protein F2P81_013474 [Scophthalmus maximus]|uniref:Amidohydrolase-related domain-containing protein n=1 Tax=Scophthalmus maximus TaxID=52904 RepID=A0A6A4SMM0_SCOMX|nr:hypothetical protein F2P81_013474 [Scophthalmus maximus]
MADTDRSACAISRVYRGTFIHSTHKSAVQILEDALLGVNTEGKIAFIGKGEELHKLTQTFGFSPAEVTQLTQNEFFMPGMVDTHIHASQYSYAGTALDLPLLQWLNTYTFPVESRFKDLEFANKIYTQIVSHISETVEEVKLVKELFPESDSYTDVYHKHNLLTEKTLMAHGCYLSDEELDLFRETGASLSHCPGSNFSLCSGVLNVRNVLNHKVKLGLGTDVAGGYSASMLDAVRRTLDASKVLTIQDPEHDTLSFEEVFRLATLGGSQALSLEDQTGNFEVGKDFDALRVNVAAPGGPIDLIQFEEPKIMLEKFLNLDLQSYNPHLPSSTNLIGKSLADNMKDVWVKDYADKYLDQYSFRHIMGPFNSLREVSINHVNLNSCHMLIHYISKLSEI